MNESFTVQEAPTSYQVMLDTPHTKQGYKQTEVGMIPEDWVTAPFVSLGSIIDGDRGANYPGSEDFLSDGYCLFLNAGNVTKAGFRFSDCAYISRDNDEKLSKGKLKRDDIVLTTRGTVGNFAHFDFTVPFEHIRINSGMVILRRDSTALDTNFLYALLKSHLAAQQIERLTFGSAQPQLTVKGISEFAIVVPPLPEQRAIATALSDVDALLAAQDKLIAKKHDIKQAAMQQLLTGKQRLPGFTGVWEVKRLGDICGRITTGKLDANAMVASGEYPFFTCAKEHYFIDEYAFDADALLVSGNGANVGYVHHYTGKFNAYQRTYVLTDFNAEIVYLRLFMDRNLQERLRTEVNAGNTPYITMDTLTDMTVALPSSKEEQAAIAAILSDMDFELTTLEQQRDKTHALKQGMMQELLTGRIRLV
jgi:type I restriction enzyme, S subunit